MTFEAEFIDAEYIDAEYAKYVDAAGAPAGKRVDWSFWIVLALLAVAVYTVAFMLQTHRSSSTVPSTLDLHECTFPEVKVDLARPNGADHDVVAPYAHSTCREGDVRLWESLH